MTNIYSPSSAPPIELTITETNITDLVVGEKVNLNDAIALSSQPDTLISIAKGQRIEGFIYTIYSGYIMGTSQFIYCAQIVQAWHQITKQTPPTPPPNTAAIIVGGGILATALGYLLLRKPKVR